MPRVTQLIFLAEIHFKVSTLSSSLILDYRRRLVSNFQKIKEREINLKSNFKIP